jgi:hypothetical protein
MNYELKSIQPFSVFTNSLRIFVVVGFLVAVLTFFVLPPNPNIHIILWWQKIAATIIFTIVYTIVFSVMLTLIAWIYNFWAASFSGVKVHFEQSEE